MTREQFLTEVRAAFPDVEIRPDETGLLHSVLMRHRPAWR